MKHLKNILLALTGVSFISFIFADSVTHEKWCIIAAVIFLLLYIINDLFNRKSIWQCI